MGKLVIDGNSVYEIDEDCIRKRGEQERWQREKGKEHDREGYDRLNPYRKP